MSKVFVRLLWLGQTESVILHLLLSQNVHCWARLHFNTVHSVQRHLWQYLTEVCGLNVKLNILFSETGGGLCGEKAGMSEPEKY